MYQHLIDRYNEHPDGDIEHIEFNKDEPYILDLTLYIYMKHTISYQRMYSF